MKAKERQITDVHINNWYVTRKSTGEEVNQGTNTTEYDTLFENIVYSEGRQNFNTCLHLKFVPHRSFPQYSAERSTGFITHSRPCIPIDSQAEAERFLELMKENINIQDFAKRAIIDMSPDLESGFELFNFLYEIKEVLMLWKWWNRRRDVLRNFSSGNLMYAFGVRPFISDMKNLYQGLKTLDERLADLKKGAGQLKRRHYSEQPLLSPVVDDEYVLWTDYRVVREYHPYHCRYTATMEYTYQIPDVDRYRTKLYALLDTIGANLDLYTVWNAIPFSFVVDWFFDVGRFLSQFRNHWVPVSLYIKQFGVSVKALGNSHYRYRLVQNDPNDWHYACRGDISVYHRFPFKVNDGIYWPSPTGEVTDRKLFLGSLLLEQKVRKGTVRR